MFHLLVFIRINYMFVIMVVNVFILKIKINHINVNVTYHIKDNTVNNVLMDLQNIMEDVQQMLV